MRLKTHPQKVWKLTSRVAVSAGLLAQSVVGFSQVPQARADWGFFETGELTQKEILADSSTGPLKIKSARLLTDNDASFQTKLDLIRNANSSLRLAYYILSNDHSSSVLMEELIEAARRGVKVRLLLDYHTNYKHLDLLSALEREGAKSNKGGSISVALFNRPSREVMKDAYFLTSDCDASAKSGDMTACSTDKLKKMESFFARESSSKTLNGKISNLSSPFMSLFLSGLYSKNPGAIKAAFFEGSGFDPKSLQGGDTPPTPAELEQLKDFGRLLFDAKFKGSLEAKIKLALAFSMYGEELDPVYRALSTVLPVERERNEAAKADWKHLTDFLHHKLLVADDTRVQLGGRNIEDSYHTQPSNLSAKYTFMDTDVLMELQKADSSIGKTFDRLFGFREMVATLAEVRQHAPNDMTQNLNFTAQAIASCQPVKKASFAQYPACVEKTFAGLPYRNLESRMNDAMQAMKEKAAIYRTQYQPATLTGSDVFDASDLRSMQVTYIENVPFNRSNKVGAEQRKYGAKGERDTRDGKSIHSLWTQGLRNTCKTSYDSKTRKRVVLHQGYVLFPANLLSAIGKMTNGEWDCRFVEIVILTNSPETTDLNIINFFARQQLKATLEQARNSSAKGKASIRVFEYKKRNDAILSLHSKVNILGDDAIIGSANADVRSYFMDTNNGVFIRGAKKFTENYLLKIGGLINDKNQTVEVTQVLIDTPSSTMIAEDIAAIRGMIAQRGKSHLLTPNRDKMLADLITKLQSHIYKTSRQLLDVRYIEIPMTDDFTREQQEREFKRLEIGDEFNSLLMLL